MTKVIIMKKDGTLTTEMDQAQTQTYLQKLILENRRANLSQALSDIFSNKGKATGNYKFDQRPVLHSSAGHPDKTSVTLFYYKDGLTPVIFAMGEHYKGKTRYLISDYGQAGTDFAQGKQILI